MDFQPKGKSRYDKILDILTEHKQKLAVAAVFVLVAFMVSSQIKFTGKAASEQALEKELNQTKIALSEMNATSVECGNSLIRCATNLSICGTGLDSCIAITTNVTGLLEQCKIKLNTTQNAANESAQNFATCRTGLNTSQTDYKDLVRNSVKDVCCTVNDATNGAIKSWVIVNNRITCSSGSFVVNCSSGQINY